MRFSMVRACGLAAVLWVGGALPVSAWCVRGVDSWDTLRMRTGPGPQAREIGAIPSNACGVSIVGGCRGSWCPVVYRGRTGWSNATYLTRGGFFAGFGLPGWGGMMTPPPRFVAPPLPRPAVAAPQARRVVAGPRRLETRRVAKVARRPAVSAREPVGEIEQRQQQRLAAPAPPQPVAPAPLPPAPPPVPAQPPAPPIVKAAPSAPIPSAGAAVAAPAAGGLATGAEVCIVNVPKSDALKVRAGPSNDQALRFGFPAEACGIKLTGSCKDGWCPIDYRGYRGWAEQKFLK